MFEKRELPLVGISLDDVPTLSHYREHDGMPFPLLSDTSKLAGTAFGVVYRFGLGSWAIDLFQTANFVTDTSGLIVGAWAKGGHQKQLLQAAVALDLMSKRAEPGASPG